MLQLAVAAGVVAVAIAVYLSWALWVNRRAGVPGLVRRLRLTCPKCGGDFDYALVPGASWSSVRLGRRRYLACPLCHRRSTFPVSVTPATTPVRPEDP